MIKTITLNELETIFGKISRSWGTSLPDLRISNKSLYALISLKKDIEEKHMTTQETVATIMKMHGAEENDMGALQLPPDKVKEANVELEDLAQQTVEITYSPVTIKEEDVIPSVLMETFYDFITIE